MYLDHKKSISNTCFMSFQGLKGEAGTKGGMGPFGVRGPVGQKVKTSIAIKFLRYIADENAFFLLWII